MFNNTISLLGESLKTMLEAAVQERYKSCDARLNERMCLDL
jgi:hypothetical protein